MYVPIMYHTYICMYTQYVMYVGIRESVHTRDQDNPKQGETDRQTERQTDRKTDRQTDRQIDR